MLPFSHHESHSVEISDLTATDRINISPIFIFLFLHWLHPLKGTRRFNKYMFSLYEVLIQGWSLASVVCGLWVSPCLRTWRSLNPKITFAYLWRWVMPAHAPLGRCLLPSQAETVIYCLLPPLLLSFPLAFFFLPYLLLLFYLAPIPPRAPAPHSLWIIRTHAGIFAAAYTVFQFYSALGPRHTALFVSIFSRGRSFIVY